MEFYFDFYQPIVQDIWPGVVYEANGLRVEHWPAYHSGSTLMGWRPTQLYDVRTVKFPHRGALLYKLCGALGETEDDFPNLKVLELALGTAMPRPLVASKVDMMPHCDFIYMRSPFGERRLNTDVFYQEDGRTYAGGLGGLAMQFW